MAYKILRISGLHYRQAEVLLHESNPSLKSESYERQQEEIFKLCLVYGDSFSKGMTKIGCESCEILYDVDSLQIAWAIQNGIDINFSDKDWRHLLVIEQIKSIKPDIVYFQDLHGLPLRYRKILKNLIPSIRLLVLHKGYPGGFDEMQDFDLVLLSMPSLVEMYGNKGIPARLYYHGFNDGVKSAGLPLTINESIGRFTFLGSSGYGHGDGHRSRYWSLIDLFQRTDLVGYIDEQFSRESNVISPLRSFYQSLPYGLLNLMAELSSKVSFNRADRFLPFIRQDRDLSRAEKLIRARRVDFSITPPGPISQFFPSRCHAPVFGLTMYKVLSESGVTLNMHADATGASVGNLRMFEATGAGACLLTDTGSNMSDLFEPDKEVVVYQSLEECIEKAKYLLNHPQEAKRIADAGMKRTLSEHTVSKRIENTLNPILLSALRGKFGNEFKAA